MGKKSTKKGKITFKRLAVGLLVLVGVVICRYIGIDIPVNTIFNDYQVGTTINDATSTPQQSLASYNLGDIPEYAGMPYVLINNNVPFFTAEEYTTKSFEEYAELDILGRCGVAYANLSKSIMPKESEERGDIGSVKPSGWKQKAYKGLVDGDYLYNRCHLIGWQLAGENANELNLITGTRYMNVEGMLPFENQVAEYLNQKANKNNHVLYRVTPIYEGSNLVANGVLLEAYSVEDEGKGVCFNVYVYNVQPGIVINYATGDNHLDK